MINDAEYMWKHQDVNSCLLHIKTANRMAAMWKSGAFKSFSIRILPKAPALRKSSWRWLLSQ